MRPRFLRKWTVCWLRADGKGYAYEHNLRTEHAKMLVQRLKNAGLTDIRMF